VIGPARGLVGKAREGKGAGLLCCDRCSGQETSEGEKPKGASDEGAWPNPRSSGGILGGVPNPEGESQHFGATANPRRVSALERAYGTVGGMKAPEG
jgi:hypothetical protein